MRLSLPPSHGYMMRTWQFGIPRDHTEIVRGKVDVMLITRGCDERSLPPLLKHWLNDEGIQVIVTLSCMFAAVQMVSIVILRQLAVTA